MKKNLFLRAGRTALAVALMASLTACSLPSKNTADSDNDDSFFGYTETDDDKNPSNPAAGIKDLVTMERPKFITASASDPSVTANVPSYAVADDFSNVVNLNQYYFDNEQLDLLKNQLFYVEGSYGSYEFFDDYEINRYAQKPNFVTVDSLMHTYHLYFSYLLQNIEKNYLADNLSELSQAMMTASQEQYNALRGSDWETSAKNNLAFFTVGAYLLDSSTSIPSEVDDMVEEELARIYAASSIDTCTITGTDEDYSQYIPRGYYENDPVLSSYFQAMMWYGRIAFTQKNETNDKSALLLTLAMKDTGIDRWEKAYTVTSFFAGASDDLGYYEYLPLIEKIYGKDVALGDLSADASKWEQFHKLTAELRAPQINSIPIEDNGDDSDNTILSFRFMGQRFSIDATIMQNLVYSRVGAKPDDPQDKRMLPDVLDVASVFGSEAATDLLRNEGDLDYQNFEKNRDDLQAALGSADSSLWNASLYASWLHTLSPLLETKPEGYPSYKLNSLWNLKALETFAGSYTELKHDTVLYSKQIMTEMGGDDDEVIDDRGYVDPEPDVYSRFATLADATLEGLRTYGLLSSNDEDNLDRLKSLASQLEQISEKELQNETLTDDEYDLIRNYGGNLEHFWKEAMKQITGEENPTVDNYPAALVTDIATDPNGTVLEIGTGRVQTIYVIVPVDGTLRIASGTVYSFYQFPWSSSDRLTDSKWRQMMGIQLNSSEEYDDSQAIDQPEWATRYRHYFDY